MKDPSNQPTAAAALDAAEKALRSLDARCCEPGRSPRMAELAATLAAVRADLVAVSSDAAAADAALLRLESAGAQIGSLQVGCCAPDRLPLYAEMLQHLTHVQLDVNRSLGRGH